MGGRTILTAEQRKQQLAARHDAAIEAEAQRQRELDRQRIQQQMRLRTDVSTILTFAPNDRIDSYNARAQGMSRFERDKVIPALAARAFHIPGNESARSDWVQYVIHNHPVFGLCCHHPLHPVKFGMRLVYLIGSIMCGLAVTNFLWLGMILQEMDSEVTVLQVNTTFTGENTSVSVTQGMVVLWTIGGSVHVLFDIFVWMFTAGCACCLPGRKWNGFFTKYCHAIIVVLVVLCTALATLVVVLRAAVEGNDETYFASVSGHPIINGTDSGYGTAQFFSKNKSEYEFLVSYAVELCLALFVYNPVFASVLFSGCLGCGCIPFLGGRPYEYHQAQLQSKAKTQRVSRSDVV